MAEQLESLLEVKNFLLAAQRHLPARAEYLGNVLRQRGALSCFLEFLNALREEDVLPIPDYMGEEADEITTTIPLNVMGIHYDSLPDFGKAACLAAAMCSDDPSFLGPLHDAACVPLREEFCVWGGVCSGQEDLKWLRGVKAGRQWRHLPSLLTWVLKKGGNAFVDYSDEEFCEMGEPNWDDIDHVVKEYARARSILGRATWMRDRVDEGGAPRLKEMACILETGMNNFLKGRFHDNRQLTLWPHPGH
ncbi:MAG: hypothetical protein HYT87_13045 [Nitrospirae bacterium]|nr:hypothetical protein [Nitrospirota bacterium]